MMAPHKQPEDSTLSKLIEQLLRDEIARSARNQTVRQSTITPAVHAIIVEVVVMTLRRLEQDELLRLSTPT